MRIMTSLIAAAVVLSATPVLAQRDSDRARDYREDRRDYRDDRREYRDDRRSDRRDGRNDRRGRNYADCRDDKKDAGHQGTAIGAVAGGGGTAALGGGVGESLLGAGVGALAGNVVGRSTEKCGKNGYRR